MSERVTRSSLTMLSKSGWMTVAAFIFGLTYIGVLAFLLYVAGFGLAMAPPQDFDQAMTTLVGLALDGKAGLALLLGLELVMAILEFIARNRSPQAGLTFPLIFLPFGRTARLFIIDLLCVLVLTPRMLVYLLYIGLSPMVDLIFKRTSLSGRFIDRFDEIWGRVDAALRIVYNALYFTKVDKNSDGLTIWFNRILVFWCIHHSKD